MIARQHLDPLIRLGVSLALLGFAWGVRDSLEGLAGGVVATVGNYWLPARVVDRRRSDRG